MHHHLIREKTRTQVGLVVETGEAREVHHMALLLGYGAGAINPYLAFETIEDLIDQGVLAGRHRAPGGAELRQGVQQGRAEGHVEDGHLHGRVATPGRRSSRPSAWPQELVDEYFTGTTSRLGGVGLDVLAEEVAARHRFAYLDRPEEAAHRDLWAGGEYQWRREGEHHLFNPETVFKLQHATRTKRYDIFKEYTQLRRRPGARSSPRCAACSSFKDGERPPVPIDEVEPVSEIVKRFSTGAMSYGSISTEAHETLAIAMNRLGGKSNTGEGGEDADRFVTTQRRPAPQRRSSRWRRAASA